MTRVFIDCTNAHHTGLNTGIQRVVRAFASHLPSVAGDAMEVRNVVLRGGGFSILEGFGPVAIPGARFRPRQALNSAYLGTVRKLAGLTPNPRVKQFLLAHKNDFGLAYLLTTPLRLGQRLRRRQPVAPPSSLKFLSGDILFLCDGIWMHDAVGAVEEAHRAGARVVLFIHDIIPLTHPQFCHPAFVKRFSAWLARMLPLSDALVFNSRHTRDTVARYVEESGLPAPLQDLWRVVYLGADLPAQDMELPRWSSVRSILGQTGNTYLCVGTLEARKNQELLIDAFEQLWGEGGTAKLLLIGRSGGMCHELVDRIRHHPQWRKRLFWLDRASDRELNHAYAHAKGLIFPSLEEGFGLPLVEALRAGLPTVCSDLPVFREIAQDRALYFPPSDSAALHRTLVRLESGQAPPMTPFSWPDWRSSTQALYEALQELSAP